MKIDINNGIICISKDTTISSGVTVKRNVMLTIKKGATLTVNGGIDAGIKTVSVMGEGTLVINGHNAFTGSIFVDGPTSARPAETVAVVGGPLKRVIVAAITAARAATAVRPLSALPLS